MSDIVRRLREPPFGTETSERMVMAEAADEIERLRTLVEASIVLNQPGALAINCIRGAVKCSDNEFLRARVAELEAQRERLRNAIVELLSACRAIDAANGRQIVDPHSMSWVEAALAETAP